MHFKSEALEEGKAKEKRNKVNEYVALHKKIYSTDFKYVKKY